MQYDALKRHILREQAPINSATRIRQSWDCLSWLLLTAMDIYQAIPGDPTTIYHGHLDGCIVVETMISSTWICLVSLFFVYCLSGPNSQVSKCHFEAMAHGPSVDLCLSPSSLSFHTAPYMQSPHNYPDTTKINTPLLGPMGPGMQVNTIPTKGFRGKKKNLITDTQ